MFGGKCLVCAEKEARIEDLKHQIETLSKLVFVPKPTQDISVSDSEVDELFNPPEPRRDDSIEREASMLLSGDYDGMHGEI